eukprot:gene5034-6424_t
MDLTINRIFAALADKIKIAHAKDVKLAASALGVALAEIDGDEAHALRGVGMIELPAPGLALTDLSLLNNIVSGKKSGLTLSAHLWVYASKYPPDWNCTPVLDQVFSEIKAAGFINWGVKILVLRWEMRG